MTWSPQQDAAIAAVTAEEVWRPIPYSTYEASTLGRIRNSKNGKVQAPQLGEDDYDFVGIRFLDRKHSEKVHRLVCLAFHGLKPVNAQCVRHLAGGMPALMRGYLYVADEAGDEIAGSRRCLAAVITADQLTALRRELEAAAGEGCMVLDSEVDRRPVA